MLSTVKLVMIGVLLTGALGATWKVWDLHKDAVEQAVEHERLLILTEQEELIRTREEELTKKYRASLEKARKELKIETKKSKDLQRMLLIDHNLDRLLQQKPGLILPRVNAGTQEFYDELEEATQ